MESISETAIHQGIVNEAFQRSKRTFPESFDLSTLILSLMTRYRGPDNKYRVNTGFNPFMIWRKFFIMVIMVSSYSLRVNSLIDYLIFLKEDAKGFGLKQVK
jgi:hypothetical protein